MKITTTHATQFNNLLRQTSLIILSVLMVKSGVSTVEMGNFETLMFISTIVSFFWLNAFLQGILSQYPSVSEAQKPLFKFNILLFTHIMIAFLAIVFIIFEKPLLNFITGHNALPDGYFKVFIFYLILNLPPYLLESFWIVEKRPLSILLYSVLSNVFLPLSILIPLWLGFSFLNSIQCMLIVASLRYLWLIFDFIKTPQLNVDKTLILSFITICLPLIGYTFLGGFVTSFSNWMVNWHYSGDKTAFAIFRMGAREFPVSLALATGLSNSMVPLLASASINKAELSFLKEKTTRLWHILFPMSILLMLTSKWLFKVAFSHDYSESADVFNIFLMILLSRAVFPNSILLALKNTPAILKISVIETVSIIALSFILIQNMGMNGLAWATLIGFLIEKILMAFYLEKRYNIKVGEYMDVKWYIFYAFLLIMSYWITLVL